jgi:hypothetical protein
VGAFPPSGGRKRWAGINPQNPLDFAQSGFGFRPANTTLNGQISPTSNPLELSRFNLDQSFQLGFKLIIDIVSIP